MGILNWLLGRRTVPAIMAPAVKVSLSMQVSAPAPAKPDEPWPTWKNGQPYSEADKKWRDLQQSAIKNAKAGDWGMYANDRLDLATEARKEGKTKRALDGFLEVAYLDINGPGNSGLEWSPSAPYASPAPAVIEWAWKAAQMCNLDVAAVRERFLTVATEHYGALRLPITPETAWPKLLAALEAHIATKVAREAAKEARRLERQAERDAKRAAQEGWKALEREQNKAARGVQKKATKAE